MSINTTCLYRVFISLVGFFIAVAFSSVGFGSSTSSLYQDQLQFAVRDSNLPDFQRFVDSTFLPLVKDMNGRVLVEVNRVATPSTTAKGGTSWFELVEIWKEKAHSQSLHEQEEFKVLESYFSFD